MAALYLWHLPDCIVAGDAQVWADGLDRDAGDLPVARQRPNVEAKNDEVSVRWGMDQCFW